MIMTKIIAVIAMVILIVIVVKMDGDVRHYKKMYENELKMNVKLFDDYRALEDKYHQAIKPAKIPDPGESGQSAEGPLLEDDLPQLIQYNSNPVLLFGRAKINNPKVSASGPLLEEVYP